MRCTLEIQKIYLSTFIDRSYMFIYISYIYMHIKLLDFVKIKIILALHTSQKFFKKLDNMYESSLNVIQHHTNPKAY